MLAERKGQLGSRIKDQMLKWHAVRTSLGIRTDSDQRRPVQN